MEKNGETNQGKEKLMGSVVVLLNESKILEFSILNAMIHVASSWVTAESEPSVSPREPG